MVRSASRNCVCVRPSRPGADLLRDAVGTSRPARPADVGVHVEDDLGIALLDADEIDEAGDFLEFRRDFFRKLLEGGHVVAENLDFDGFGRAFEIAEHVLEDLRELDVDAGDILRDLRERMLRPSLPRDGCDCAASAA